MAEPISISIAAAKTVKAAATPREVLTESLKETAETAIKETPVQSVMTEIENSSLETLKAQNEGSLTDRFNELAPKSPLYENNPSRLNWMERFEKALKGTDGFERTKMKTLSANADSARGSFAELARAYRANKAGLEVEAIGKNIKTEIGKTDIDVLIANKKGERLWIENKDVKNISLTDDFKIKIDKMSQGLKEGVTDNSGNHIKIDKAVFVNNKNISQNAIEYAKSKGIHIKENMAGRAFQKYIQNI